MNESLLRPEVTLHKFGSLFGDPCIHPPVILTAPHLPATILYFLGMPAFITTWNVFATLRLSPKTTSSCGKYLNCFVYLILYGTSIEIIKILSAYILERSVRYPEAKTMPYTPSNSIHNVSGQEVLASVSSLLTYPSLDNA